MVSWWCRGDILEDSHKCLLLSWLVLVVSWLCDGDILEDSRKYLWVSWFVLVVSCWCHGGMLEDSCKCLWCIGLSWWYLDGVMVISWRTLTSVFGVSVCLGGILVVSW